MGKLGTGGQVREEVTHWMMRVWNERKGVQQVNREATRSLSILCFNLTFFSFSFFKFSLTH